jgi:hypothetical protein
MLPAIVVAEKCLLTVEAKIVVEHGDGTVGVKRDVCFLVDQEVVAGALADDPEIVNERFGVLSVLKRALEGIRCYTRRLILVAGGFAGTHDTLGLKMSRSAHVPAVE